MSVSDLSFLPEDLIEVHQRFVMFIDEVKQWEADIMQSDQLQKELQARVRARSKELGFFYKMQPREFGGRPAGPLEIVMLQESLASSNIRSGAQIFGPHPGLLGGATGRLHDEYLEPLLAGEKHGAFGFTEPDDAPRRTWATLDADKLVVNGQKSYVTGGDTSDFVSCLVNIEDSSRRKLGSAMVIIDCNGQGVSIKHVFNTLDGTSHAHMVFQDVQVPAWHMVCEPGHGLPKAMAQIAGMRLSLSAQCVGWGRWVLDFVRETVNRPHARRGQDRPTSRPREGPAGRPGRPGDLETARGESPLTLCVFLGLPGLHLALPPCQKP